MHLILQLPLSYFYYLGFVFYYCATMIFNSIRRNGLTSKMIRIYNYCNHVRITQLLYIQDISKKYDCLRILGPKTVGGDKEILVKSN